ncbi:Methyltransferase domain-containing protein [Amycolatopsis pretoriensis]|uniref:Methyltransferase domain-containing protein n=1 Tax=Amycolatopsis pretoriensis TaxID=218821 RepID=A0A1H5QNM4_9PSEU|nr:methyltransferase domain-containing protein [Amycolatopsis pretoriensis]SEF27444.1 Methyltransferase domain-containing protein [Amycolatopsis pretoriensis]
MPETDEFRPENRIGAILVSSRSLDEYRRMFALTDGDLAGRLLDCPGGAAGFTAEVNAAGGTAVACDPVYAHPVEQVRATALESLRRGYAYHQANPDEYVWTYFRDPEHYLRARTGSVELFARDRGAHPENYVEAALPELPFADGQFDLVLSSHLLFSYADRYDREFHLASLRELARVGREVRVFPLVPMGSAENPELAAVRAELAAAGLPTTVRRVGYEFQRGGDTMMTIGGEPPA